ncbi:hypothetical protein SAMN04487897_11276 [Paenibacillus sp. yr247]|nr:hypothetical protein SAMN04487897_11276 [Paenibacillus sp. yr247]
MEHPFDELISTASSRGSESEISYDKKYSGVKQEAGEPGAYGICDMCKLLR